MTVASNQTSLPTALVDAARLRRDGASDAAVALLVSTLEAARSTPLDVAFHDRVQLGTTLADLYVAADKVDLARSVLADESAFADKILLLTRRTGTPEQVRAAWAARMQVRDRATQVNLLGRPAPEMDAVDWVLGAPTTIGEQRGRVVLLEFWAPWCRPCLEIFPALRDLHQRYAERGVTVVALTRYSGAKRADPGAQQGLERNTVCRAVEGRSVTFPVGITLDGQLQRRYGAIGVPAFAVVDRTGMVRFASSTPDHAEVERAVLNLLSSHECP